ncbi:hypothetical protein QYE76_043311 [Lolium multiflorum]|uniref:KIB1-4 beta-propeller domain-containing protein n=1 Tax=Lolium multiflorum TaxID=4521 RepID=A0AAD8TIT8_LOLMU|nr:hypothetical protein QYE76_043311 [Lolium multiflorum]
MAGSRRRRRRGRARSLQQGAESSALADATLTSSEVTIVGSPSKNTCHASGSTSLLSSEPHGFADLLDSLLHEIIDLFTSFHDFLAFIGTCRAWRAAVSSFPSAYTFSFPPVHLKPDGPYVPPHTGNIKPMLLSNCKWQLSEPSKKNLSLFCSVPQNTPDNMYYLGCSCGYLIFSYREHCILVNVFTGTKVKPPKLPPNNELGEFCGIGILTAALSSPNSRLLLCSRTSMFEWQVGTNSWSEHALALERERITQILLFNGDIVVFDSLLRLHTIRLAPQFSMQEVAIKWSFLPFDPMLVVCGDKLLMVHLLRSSDKLNGSYRFFKVFHLDFSVRPAKWVKMEKLDNQALFVSLDTRTPTFSCMSPERWGGKSNCIYVAKLFEDPDETWTAVELGQPVYYDAGHAILYSSTFPHDYSLLCSLWVLPSSVYGSG